MVVTDFAYKTVDGWIHYNKFDRERLYSIGLKDIAVWASGHPGGEYEVLARHEDYIWTRKNGIYYSIKVEGLALLVKCRIDGVAWVGPASQLIEKLDSFAIGDKVLIKTNLARIWTIKIIVDNKAWITCEDFDAVKELSSITKV